MKPNVAKTATKRRLPSYKIAVRNAIQLLDQQLATLQFCKLQNELLVAREQVLVDCILQLAEAASFRNIIEEHGMAGPTTGATADADDGEGHDHLGQQQQQQRLVQQHEEQQSADTQDNHCAAGNYTTRLLRGLQNAAVQQVLGWQANKWHALFSSTASQTSILLRVVDRSISGPEQDQEQPQQQKRHHEAAAAAGGACMDAAYQRLYQVVDHLAALGLVGTIFSDQVGQQVGACTSINHITMQQESPSQDHWRRVLQQLQPSHLQLVQLSAGFQEFVRLRRVHQSMQLALTAHVDCLVSCNSQTLVAAGREGSGATFESATVVEGGTGSSGVPSTAAAATAAAAAAAATAASPGSLMSQLLLSLNNGWIMMQALMLNTLTCRQIAELIVASFPYVPRPAPLMEAAYELLLTDPQYGCVPDQDSMGSAAAVGVTVAATATTLSAAAGGRGDEGPEQRTGAGADKALGAAGVQVDVHMQQRIGILQQQVQHWWLLELQQQQHQ